MKSLFSAVMLELFTTSAVPMLSWKEQLTSSAYCVDCNSNACLAISGELGVNGTRKNDVMVELSTLRGKVYILLQLVKVKDCILNFIMFVKMRPTGPLQTTFAV